MGNINLLNKALNFSKIVNLIHIGAHKGEEINLYETYEFEKIYLVEPIKECADLIEKKIRNNPRFEIFNCAMGSENKFLKFFVADGEDSGSSSLLAPRKSDILFSQIVPVFEDPTDEALHVALREWRKATAAANRKRPFRVFPERTLQDLVAKKPTTTSELKKVWGLGPARLARHGDEVLAVVREYVVSR